MSVKFWNFESFELNGDYMPMTRILERDGKKDVLFVGDNIHNPWYSDWLDGYIRGLHDFCPQVLEEMRLEKVNIDSWEKIEEYKEYLDLAGNYVEFRDQIEIKEELDKRHRGL